MQNKLEKIMVLEQRIKALESRLSVNQDSDIEVHIRRLKARKQEIEHEVQIKNYLPL